MTTTTETDSQSWSNLQTGGWAVSLGALGVGVTSVLYAVCRRAQRRLPQPFDRIHALIGAIDGAATLHAAGTIGIFSDMAMAAGASLIAFEIARRNRGSAALGWVTMVLAVIVFTVIDVLAGFVLSPLAAAGGDGHAFEGFKRLFDALFLLGTATTGAGAMLALIAEGKTAKPLIAKPVCQAGTVIGLLGFVAAVACFCGLPFDLAAGGSIFLIAVVFIIAGWQIARAKVPAIR